MATSRAQRLVAVAAVAVAGCYHPSFRDLIACDVDHSCPSGLICGPDELCRSPGEPGGGPGGDGAPSEGPPGDASVFTTVMSGVPLTQDLAAPGDGNVYYTSLGDVTATPRNGAIGRAARTGGGAALATGLLGPRSIVVAGNYVYWIDVDPTTHGPAVGMVPAAGGNPQWLGMSASSLATDGSNVYIQAASEIDRVQIGTLLPYTVVVSGITSDITGNSLLVDATDLYWVEAQRDQNGQLMSSTVRKRGKTGGNVITLVTSQRPLEWIAMDESFVYGLLRSTAGAGSDNGAILRVPRSGGAYETVAAAQSPQRVAIDADHVYWINKPYVMDGEILRCPKTRGCAPEVVVPGRAGQVLALDGSDVYWAEGTDILRRPKP